MSPITTHVLDTALGRPAAGVRITLEQADGAGWKRLGEGATDADGRLKSLLGAGTALEAATYRLTFDTAAYFAATERRTFYPSVTVVFEVTRPTEHHHVPLLLSPYGYSTYRGS